MISSVEFVFVLLVVFQVKHFLGDFPLQRDFMLQKDRPGWKFVRPLALHCLVHGSLTLAIVLVVNPLYWWLAVFDFVVHFLMDRIKASPNYLGRFDDKSKPAFWNCLGFDQMVHHLTHYTIIAILVTSRFPLGGYSL